MLTLYTIYDRPRDYPDAFVVRAFTVGAATHGHGHPVPTAQVVVVRTLDEARASLPPGLVWLGRDAEDEPQIVETWV